MTVDLVRIGNSRGIRIPKSMIKQCGFGDTVELRVENQQLIIAPGHAPRRGWKQVFESAPACSQVEDKLLLRDLRENEFDREEWQW
jgi:antitoxin MazE